LVLEYQKQSLEPLAHLGRFLPTQKKTHSLMWLPLVEAVAVAEQNQVMAVLVARAAAVIHTHFWMCQALRRELAFYTTI
jgi:hypothetical protein